VNPRSLGGAVSGWRDAFDKIFRPSILAWGWQARA